VKITLSFPGWQAGDVAPSSSTEPILFLDKQAR